MIQPDYGRFVRNPIQAAAGAGLGLGLAFPLILMLASFVALATGAPHVISAMIMLGLGIPALASLLLGTWIDASACLYSASLSFASQLPRATFTTIVLTITLVGIALVLLGAETVFVPFLVSLGIALPPLATVLILAHLSMAEPACSRVAIAMVACWFVGTISGIAAHHGAFRLTGLPALDSILVAVVAFAIAKVLVVPRASRSVAS